MTDKRGDRGLGAAVPFSCQTMKTLENTYLFDRKRDNVIVGKDAFPT